MARKFIINNGEVVMGGGVEYHIELLGKSRKKELTTGGGRFEIDEKSYGKVIFFYGTSDEFKSATREQFFKAWENSINPARFDDYEIFFSEKEYFSDALAEYKKSKDGNDLPKL